MSFEEKNLIKDLKKLSFSSLTPFVSIPEPTATVSLKTKVSAPIGGRSMIPLVEDNLVTNLGGGGLKTIFDLIVGKIGKYLVKLWSAFRIFAY